VLLYVGEACALRSTDAPGAGFEIRSIYQQIGKK